MLSARSWVSPLEETRRGFYLSSGLTAVDGVPGGPYGRLDHIYGDVLSGVLLRNLVCKVVDRAAEVGEPGDLVWAGIGSSPTWATTPAGGNSSLQVCPSSKSWPRSQWKFTTRSLEPALIRPPSSRTKPQGR